MNYARLQIVADKMISKYGQTAILRRSTGDRACIAVCVDYKPVVNTGPKADMIPQMYLVSAANLDPGPDMGRDTLILIDPVSGAESAPLKIVAPSTKLSPGGIVVYWEIHIIA
jgi:hypothetical protein